MRSTQRAWRTAASRGRIFGGPPAAAVDAPSQAAAMPSVQPDDLALGKPWQQVGWSLPLIGLLIYLVTVVTYRIQLGQEAIIIALIGVALQREALRFPPFLLFFAGFYLWSVAGLATTDFPGVVWNRLIDLGKVGLIALVIVNALRSRAQQRAFMFVALAAFAMYPLRGTLFNYFGGYTLDGRAIWNYAFDNPNDLAAIALLFLGMTVGLYVREPRGWPKLAALAGTILIPFAVLITQSRGAILAMGGLAVLLLVQQQRKLRTLLAVAGIGTVVALAAPDSLWDRLSGLTKATDTSQLSQVDESGSAEQRFTIWRVAVAIFRDHPVTGVGVGAYRYEHARKVGDVGLADIAAGLRDAHSTYLTVLAETGVIGGVLWGGVVLSVLVGAEVVRRQVRSTLPRSAQQILFVQLGIVAFLLAGIFGSYSHVAFTYIMLAFLWAITQSAREEAALLAGGARRPR